nr:TraX family protein [Clostridium indicum]
MLKILALIFIFLDHIAEFIPGVPIWLHWIGRVSAPIFFFCMVWGFNGTTSYLKI